MWMYVKNDVEGMTYKENITFKKACEGITGMTMNLPKEFSKMVSEKDTGEKHAEGEDTTLNFECKKGDTLIEIVKCSIDGHSYKVEYSEQLVFPRQ